MEFNPDIKSHLASWPYDPDDCVRITTLADGREVMQVRLPLGLEQYELEGRPDGQRPHDADSVLDYQIARRDQAAHIVHDIVASLGGSISGLGG